MACLAKVELFAANEIAVVHVMNRAVRRCFLLGDDAITGKNYDHRKQWIEDELQKLAGAMGIDLLGCSLDAVGCTVHPGAAEGFGNHLVRVGKQLWAFVFDCGRASADR
jgi:hypothetical protein